VSVQCIFAVNGSQKVRIVDIFKKKTTFV